MEKNFLDEFAKYLLELPEVCVVTQKELNDSNWKLLFEAGLIVHYMIYYGDENSPHIHTTYIPYTTNSSTGGPSQHAFAQTFKDLGHPTTMKQAVTESGELVWQKDEQLELMLESLDKGAEAERQLSDRITDKSAELNETLQDLTDKKSEVQE